MNLKTFIILVFVSISSSSIGQVNEIEMYKTAFSYLNDSIIKVNYGNAKTLRNDCKQHVKGIKLKFDDELQVANEFIQNDSGFPLCDLLQKKYKITESCIYALGSGELKLTKQVQDSLEVFWDDYEMKNESKIAESLKGFVSERKDGYVVFFSDVYKNTLAAEVKSFCLPYNKITWFGSSTSFFFIFTDEGEIKEIYSGVTIHYN